MVWIAHPEPRSVRKTVEPGGVVGVGSVRVLNAVCEELAALKKAVEDILEREKSDDEEAAKEEMKILSSNYNLLVERDRKRYIADLTRQMTELAKNLEFEKAALLRDEIQRIKDRKDLES